MPSRWLISVSSALLRQRIGAGNAMLTVRLENSGRFITARASAVTIVYGCGCSSMRFTCAFVCALPTA